MSFEFTGHIALEISVAVILEKKEQHREFRFLFYFYFFRLNFPFKQRTTRYRLLLTNYELLHKNRILGSGVKLPCIPKFSFFSPTKFSKSVLLFFFIILSKFREGGSTFLKHLLYTYFEIVQKRRP